MTLPPVFRKQFHLSIFSALFLITSYASAQTFLLAEKNPFLFLTDSSIIFTRPAIADLDGDGDLDIFMGDKSGNFSYFEDERQVENIGPAPTNIIGAREWKFRRSNDIQPFGINLEKNPLFPVFTDIDADGDLDLMGGDYNGNFLFLENKGTATNPFFGALQYNPFGLVKLDRKLVFPTFADMDDDKDMDMIAGDNEGVIYYFENSGTPALPSFSAAVINPFGLDTTFSYAAPALSDIDADGDIDLLVAGRNGSFRYYENTGNKRFPKYAPALLNPFGLDSIDVNILPTFSDFDKDGDMDLMVTNFQSHIYYYENISQSSLGADMANPAFMVKISPNPVENFMEIETKETLTKIEIRELNGRPVIMIKDPEDKILLAKLEPETYIIEFTNVRNEKVLKRFEKKR